MVGRLTPNLRWQTATPLLQQILGRPVERLNGRPFLRFVHADDREQVEKALTDTFKEGESHNIVFRVLRSVHSGDVTQSPNPAEDSPPTYRYLQADVMAYYDGDGRPEQLRCHFIDVTERVLAEKALRRRSVELMRANERLQQINRDLERLKESYRDLYHHAPVMYFSLDDRGRFAAVNETLLAELGFGRDELLNQPYMRILGPEARETHRADPGVLQRAGEIETQWVSKDGRLRDVWVGTSTIKDTDGRVVRSRCAAADITERNQLAQAVVGRAHDLEEANTQLRRINQELEEFTYVVSHDLKEPLRTLEAFSSFLEADYGVRLDEDGREYISHLVAASRRLGTLIDDLLTLSRAGRVIGAPRPLDWDIILNTVLSDLVLLITRRPNSVIHIDKPLPAVQGDPERILQLLANLVGNALKYNESSHPRVVIGSIQEDGRNSMATLFVRDNGMGIDPRYHEQIFRIFRRLHRRDEFEGTGAGLAICKKIVEAHGGKLWVESAPEQGSTFFFTLPRYLTRLQESEHAPATAAAGG
jgi:PAS domain S-box-containing protein